MIKTHIILLEIVDLFHSFIDFMFQLKTSKKEIKVVEDTKKNLFDITDSDEFREEMKENLDMFKKISQKQINN